MKLKKLPSWLIGGILIFLILTLLSLVGLILKFNPLFWIIIPSVIFEEIFERCCYSVSNNQALNFIFIIVFWFVIGALSGKIAEKLNHNI